MAVPAIVRDFREPGEFSDLWMREFRPAHRLIDLPAHDDAGSIGPRYPACIINIAPAPTLTGLEGAHDGMAGAMEMFGGVFTGRLIATADVAALQT